MHLQSQQGCPIRTGGLAKEPTSTHVSVLHSFIGQEAGLHVRDDIECSKGVHAVRRRGAVFLMWRWNCVFWLVQRMGCLKTDWLTGSCVLKYFFVEAAALMTSADFCILYFEDFSFYPQHETWKCFKAAYRWWANEAVHTSTLKSVNYHLE